MPASLSESVMNRTIDAMWLCALPTDLRARQLAKRLGLSEVRKNMGLAIYGTNGAEVDARATRAALVAAGYEKYFENAYFSNALSGSTRQLLVQAYFNTISSNYASLARQGFNAACYDSLFDVARSLKKKFRNCLDFGCGPATILESSIVSFVPEVVGWDFSGRMRQLARNKGLPVLREVDFLAATRQFDLVLSAYVFHYGTVSAAVLQRISRHLEIGGLFVANFHKDLGLDGFLSTLNGVGGLAFTAPISRGPHGSVVLLSRII